MTGIALLLTHDSPPLLGGMEYVNQHLPTTSTMARLRSAYPVSYVPITVGARVGKSSIKPERDGIRFLLIIFKIATLYSPLKLFVPASAMFFLLGCGNYAWTFMHDGLLTNGSTGTVSGITLAITGSYAETSNCGATLPSGATLVPMGDINKDGRIEFVDIYSSLYDVYRYNNGVLEKLGEANRPYLSIFYPLNN